MKAYLVALIGWMVFVGIAWAIVDGTERVADKRRRFRLLTHVGIALFSMIAVFGFGVFGVIVMIPILVILDRMIIRQTRFCDRVGHIVTENFGQPILECPRCGAPVH
jgi:hypothetical protein